MIKFVIEDNKLFRCETDEYEVNIPDNVRILRIHSFEDNDVIKKIVCSKSVVIIDTKAFRNCINLEEVIIKEGTTIIGEHAFDNCIKLKKIYLPKNN